MLFDSFPSPWAIHSFWNACVCIFPPKNEISLDTLSNKTLALSFMYAGICLFYMLLAYCNKRFTAKHFNTHFNFYQFVTIQNYYNIRERLKKMVQDLKQPTKHKGSFLQSWMVYIFYNFDLLSSFQMNQSSWWCLQTTKKKKITNYYSTIKSLTNFVSNWKI